MNIFFVTIITTISIIEFVFYQNSSKPITRFTKCKFTIIFIIIIIFIYANSLIIRHFNINPYDVIYKSNYVNLSTIFNIDYIKSIYYKNLYCINNNKKIFCLPYLSIFLQRVVDTKSIAKAIIQFSFNFLLNS